jgi:hypothetical protein
MFLPYPFLDDLCGAPKRPGFSPALLGRPQILALILPRLGRLGNISPFY